MVQLHWYRDNILYQNIIFALKVCLFPSDFKLVHFHGPLKVLWALGTVPSVPNGLVSYGVKAPLRTSLPRA